MMQRYYLGQSTSTLVVFTYVAITLATISGVGCSDQELVLLNLGDTAVVSGDYDIIEDVLTIIGSDVTLNFDLFDGYLSGPWDYEALPGQENNNGRRSLSPNGDAMELLTDPNGLTQYDTLFLNCGFRTIDPETFNPNLTDPPNEVDGVIAQNLRSFVYEGGSLYASDWAYLAVEEAWPEKIDFYPPDPPAEDTRFLHPTAGPSRGYPTGYQEDYLKVFGRVTSDPLKNAIGKSLVEVDYNLSHWIVIDSVASDVTTFVRGDILLLDEVGSGRGPVLSDRPLLVGFEYGAGKVFFTTFHNESPDENLNNANADMFDILNFLVFEFHRE